MVQPLAGNALPNCRFLALGSFVVDEKGNICGVESQLPHFRAEGRPSLQSNPALKRMPQETTGIGLFLGSRGLTGVLRVLPKPGAVDAPRPEELGLRQNGH